MEPLDLKHLTLRAHKVLQLALRRALASDRDSIASEHLLAALLEEGSGLAVSLLDTLGVDVEQLTTRIGDYVDRGDPDQLVHRRLPLAEDMQRALKFSAEEARLMGSPFIGTEHLLLGLLHDKDNLGGEILDQSGLELDKARSCLQSIAGMDTANAPDTIEEDEQPSQESSLEDNSSPAHTGLDGFTARAIQAVGAAREEAGRCGRYHVGTDHLLLGILADNRSAAVNSLRKHIQDIEKLKEELRSLSRLI